MPAPAKVSEDHRWDGSHRSKQVQRRQNRKADSRSDLDSWIFDRSAVRQSQLHIVAADFGTSITASERQATEIELLRGEERTRRNLPRRGKFHGPCIRQGLVPREPEIQHGESRRRAIMEGTQEYLAEKFIDAQSKRRPGRHRPRQMARNFGAGIRKVRHHLRSRTDRKYRLPSVAMTSKEP